MKEIKLFFSDKIALVDDEDFIYVMSCLRPKANWHEDFYGYVRGWCNIEGKRVKVLLHRLVMKCPIDDGYDIDHINRIKKNCQKSNLRRVSHQENRQNTKAYPLHKRAYGVVYRGVSFKKDRNKFVAFLKINYKKIHIGYFKTEIDAAVAYNKAALHLLGDRAQLNIIKSVKN